MFPNDTFKEMKPPLVTGLYGCTCHPFKDWDEHDSFNKQKIIIGAKYQHRCTGKIGIVKGLHEDSPEWVHIFYEPYDCPRCNESDHKLCLILISKP